MLLFLFVHMYTAPKSLGVTTGILVCLACCDGKHFSTYLHPVAITVEISKPDFCACSSSQFS